MSAPGRFEPPNDLELLRELRYCCFTYTALCLIHSAVGGMTREETTGEESAETTGEESAEMVDALCAVALAGHRVVEAAKAKGN